MVELCRHINLPFHHLTLERDINGVGVANDDSSWLDDGQPLDSTTREISFAFEHVLGRIILSDLYRCVGTFIISNGAIIS